MQELEQAEEKATSSLTAISRPTLRETVARQIREAIASGELKSGERVTELGLAKKLHVAQSTMREALLELEHQGFIERESSRVTRIASLSRGQIAEVHLVRSRLEMLVIELLADRQNGEWNAAADAVARMTRFAAQDRHGEFFEADLDFHRALWDGAGNEQLRILLELLTPKLFAFGVKRHARQSHERLVRTAEEHGRLLETVKAGRTQEAIALQQALFKRAWAEDVESAER